MVGVLGLLAVAYVAFTALDGGALLPDSAGVGAAPPIGVLTTAVINTDNDVRFEAIGTGRAKQSVQLYPRVSDEIIAINFAAGNRVNQGDVLVQLDDREEKLAVKLAEVTIRDAKSLLQRYERAVKDGAVPQSEVDSARAAVDTAEVRLQQAQLALENHQIIAPFAGVVGIPQADVGDRVLTSDIITGLDDRDILYVDFDVPEKLAGMLEQGQGITATTPSFAQKTFTGSIDAIENRVDMATRTIRARAHIPNEGDLLRPGMSFAVRLDIAGESYPTVPEIAVQWGREGAFVWVVRDDVAHQEPVSVVARRGGSVLVQGELEENAQVVVEGLQRMRDGAAVAAARKEEIPDPSATVAPAGADEAEAD